MIEISFWGDEKILETKSKMTIQCGLLLDYETVWEIFCCQAGGLSLLSVVKREICETKDDVSERTG